MSAASSAALIRKHRPLSWVSANLARLLSGSLADSDTELRQEDADNQQAREGDDTHLARAVRDREQQAGCGHHADQEDEDDTEEPKRSEKVSHPRARDRAKGNSDSADDEDENCRLPGVPGR